VFGELSYKWRLEKKCLVSFRTNDDWRKNVWWAFVQMTIGEKVFGGHSYKWRLEKNCLAGFRTNDDCRKSVLWIQYILVETRRGVSLQYEITKPIPKEWDILRVSKISPPFSRRDDKLLNLFTRPLWKWKTKGRVIISLS
jgi:hypothetical protein